MNTQPNFGGSRCQNIRQEIVTAGYRRAELLLIGELIVVFAVLLQPHGGHISRFCDKLPVVTSAVGHGICSALVS